MRPITLCQAPMPTRPSSICAKWHSKPRAAETLSLLETVAQTCRSLRAGHRPPCPLRLSESPAKSIRMVSGWRCAAKAPTNCSPAMGRSSILSRQSNALGRHVQEQCLSHDAPGQSAAGGPLGMRFELEIREPFLDFVRGGICRPGLDASALLDTVDGLPQGKQPLRAFMTSIPNFPRDPRPQEGAVRRRRGHRLRKRGLDARCSRTP